MSDTTTPEYRTGFDEAPSTFTQEDAAPADYPPPSDAVSREQAIEHLDYLHEAYGIRADWEPLADIRRFIEQSGRSGVSADPLPDLIEGLGDLVSEGTVLMKVETDMCGDPAYYRIGIQGLGEDAHKEFHAPSFEQALRQAIDGEPALSFEDQRLVLWDFDDPQREEVEAIVVCLGDDAAQLRETNPEDERADNMEEAAAMLERLERANRQNYEHGCKLYAQLSAAQSQPLVEPTAEKLDSQVHDHTDTHIYATIEAACWGEYSIEATRETERDDWYVVVTAPSGIKDYDGTWRRSYDKGLDEVIQQAIEGAMLRAVPTPNLSAVVAASQHQVKKGEE